LRRRLLTARRAHRDAHVHIGSPVLSWCGRSLACLEAPSILERHWAGGAERAERKARRGGRAPITSDVMPHSDAGHHAFES
jgi:hypothetical protein